jgi:hypothetical protein
MRIFNHKSSGESTRIKQHNAGEEFANCPDFDYSQR